MTSSESDSMNDPQLVAEFVTEATESLADIENQLLQIEEASADIDSDLVNTVFRGIHSIKGVAGFLGLSTINKLAHRLEDVLNLIRNRELVPTSSIVDVMLRAADELRAMTSAPEQSNEMDVSEHVEALSTIHDNAVNALKQAAVDTEVGVSVEKIAEEVLELVSDEMANEDASPTPADEASIVAADEVRSETAAEKSKAVAQESQDSSGADPSVEQQSAPTAEVAPPQTPASESIDVSAASTKKSRRGTQPARGGEQGGKSKFFVIQPETNIRVPITTLDHLMNLAGEMVLNRNRLLQFTASESSVELSTLASDIDHITCELQDAIMQTRMQPIATVFDRFPRVVRDLSSKLGKRCKLEINGKDVEVDKSIIEAIGDPLTHIIRNSVDHGVEDPDTREAANKPATGTIRLAAYHRAGQVCIDIEDDGGGIDPEKLKKKAIDKDLISANQAMEMGKREALSLIFHPGFSTAEKLTDVSGRGVGMDVVRTNIERIGGAVDVDSEVGEGTKIQIVLPLTLAIIRSLIVGCQSRRFAIPQVSVSELVRLSAQDTQSRVERVNDALAFRLRGALIPLVSIREVLGIRTPDGSVDDVNAKAMNIVVLESGRSRYGMIVDELHDSEEIVVKPLGRDLKDCKSIAGATILGDGGIAFILDVTGIADKSGLNSIEKEASQVDVDGNAKDFEEHQQLLLFKNSPADRFAIPLALISRIERTAVDQIETYGGRSVLQYRGGLLPLVTLESVLNVSPRDDKKHVSIVVVNNRDGEFGLIAPTIEDVRDVAFHVDENALLEDGVLGSQVIDGITTRLVDVYRLLEIAFPSSRMQYSAAEPEPEKHTLLVVEDSKFFRQQVAKHLRQMGFDIIEAADGAIALDILQQRVEEIDLVVTDVEMPNMNGLELSKSIRADMSLAHLPIIALTSLASDDDISRGLACGVNEYQIKLDRDSLAESVQRLVGKKQTVGV